MEKENVVHIHNGIFLSLKKNEFESVLVRWGSFPGGSVVKNPPANIGDTRDASSIPGSGRSPGGGKGNPFQYSCLENPRDGRASWAVVYGVTQSQTRLKRLSSSSSSSKDDNNI